MNFTNGIDKCLMVDEETSSLWHPSAGQALIAWLWRLPAGHQQLRTPISDKFTYDQDGPRQKQDRSVIVWNTNAGKQTVLISWLSLSITTIVSLLFSCLLVKNH